MTDDWLVGGNRAERAHDRLVDLAADLIAQRGIDAFDLGELARRAHCSRATLYRHGGGKHHLVEAVLQRTSAGIVGSIHAAVTGTSGRERAVLAMTTALREVRGDRVAGPFLRSRHAVEQAGAITRSPTVLGIAAELIWLRPGEHDSTAAASFVVRSVLALLLWPPDDPTDEDHAIDLVARAVAH
ncbi:TetR/AcrR family transcriptional regulator [Gordonia sp. OPL2]|uniref:TetR/AcrR family transcriptional regulator n=1 Tax=Gordonia sp. OPL2 TaxID=2486274 RepID=UPI0016559A28|nr:TetR/AcrR family transcriptional regulator [Gordonia sp. OPL2]RPA12379.1 TetR/AcrR family transcriptional regulator [Gordonia sp. OPL2]